MPSPIDPRSMDLYATPHTASPKECRNEQGTVVHMRHLAAGEETRLPRNSVNTPNGISVNIARDGMEGLEDRTAASDDDNIIDDIASVGVEGREELGTVPDELSQYQSSNNVEGLVTLNQNEDENNETKQNVIVEMIMRGYNPIRVQSAVDAILSNDPNATLTPVAVEHNLQERSLSQEGSENVVMVGAGSESIQYDKRMQMENKKWREAYLCKVCYEDYIREVFLPCGHLGSCNRCFQSMNDTCNICKKHIVSRTLVHNDV